MTQCNVLRVNAVEEREEYRDSVAEILRLVQSDHNVTLLEISEAIDVSLGTISNAANKKADLSPTFLLRLGKRYGAYVLDPWLRSIGARTAPVAASECDDVLPIINMAAYRVAEARSPASEGGTTETLREQLNYLPDLRRLHREIGSLIIRVENRRAAA